MISFHNVQSALKSIELNEIIFFFYYHDRFVILFSAFSFRIRETHEAIIRRHIVYIIFEPYIYIYNNKQQSHSTGDEVSQKKKKRKKKAVFWTFQKGYMYTTIMMEIISHGVSYSVHNTILLHIRRVLCASVTLHIIIITRRIHHSGETGAQSVYYIYI